MNQEFRNLKSSVAMVNLERRIWQLEQRSGEQSGNYHVITVPGHWPLSGNDDDFEAAKAQAIKEYEVIQGPIGNDDSFMVRIVNAQR